MSLGPLKKGKIDAPGPSQIVNGGNAINIVQ